MKKILFITKNFPPTKGWMEQYSLNLYNFFRENTEVYLIANTRGKYFLPVFWFIVLIRALFYIKKVDIIYIGDGSISFLWYLLWKVFKKKIYITVHGLDITWKNRIYQKYIPGIIWKYDTIVCVSSYTKDICIEKGIDRAKITVIPNWLDFWKLPKINTDIDRQAFLKERGITISHDQKILLSVWRFVERKWFHNFIENILPGLNPQKYQYILCGSWDMKPAYDTILEEKWIRNVHVLTKQDFISIATFYAISDLFIMPNIRVPWDMEWFWIVAIEAWYYGLPVITTWIEWIADAVIDGKTGIFVNDSRECWIDTIENFDYTMFKRDVMKKYVTEMFDIQIVNNKYKSIIN